MTSSDRYAPPGTIIAEVVSPDRLLASRPRSIVWACMLMLASMAVGMVSLLPEVDPLMAGEAAAMTAMIWGLSLVFAALFKVRRPF